MSEKRTGNFYLSGGASNSDPALSLGGVESANMLGYGTAVWSGTAAPGVTLVGCYGEVSGIGQLKVDATLVAGNLYIWWYGPTYEVGDPQENTQFIYYDYDGDSQMILPALNDLSHGIIIDIDYSVAITGSQQFYNVNVTRASPELFPVVTEAQSLSGVTQYRCLYLRNEEGVAKTARIWMDNENPSPDTVELGTVYSSGGSVEATIADEFTDPGVANWGTYQSESEALEVSLGANESIGIWFRRTVAQFNTAGKTAGNINIFASLT